MKKIILFLLITTFANAQKLSYGAILGFNFYEVANSGATMNFEPSGGSPMNIGVYGEFNFTNKIGVKTEVTINKKNLKIFNSTEKVDISLFEISPSLKYDFGQEYRKGFYMLLGPKFSLMTKATSDGDDVKDAFKTTNLGLQYGIGTRVLKYFDIEGKLDYEVTSFHKLGSYTSNFMNVYINLGIDLERLF